MERIETPKADALIGGTGEEPLRVGGMEEEAVHVGFVVLHFQYARHFIRTQKSNAAAKPGCSQHPRRYAGIFFFIKGVFGGGLERGMRGIGMR